MLYYKRNIGSYIVKYQVQGNAGPDIVLTLGRKLDLLVSVLLPVMGWIMSPRFIH